MTDNKFRFSDNRLRKLKPVPGKKRSYYYDSSTTGLRMQVTLSGVKTFQFQTWDKIRKKPVTRTLGRYPALPLSKAKKKAVKEMAAVNEGRDIESEAQAMRNEDTFSEMFSQWIDNHAKPHKKSWEEDKRRYRLYIEKPFGKKKLSWFTTARIRKWHLSITTLQKQRGGGTITPSTANRALALVSTVFNQMRTESSNPCKGVKKFREQSRDRFLQPDELKRFFKALDHPETPDYLRDYLLISIFTGARRSNVLSMRWTDIDFTRCILTIPADESKNKEAMDVPLINQAIDILNNRKNSTQSIFVFASKKSKSGHIEDPKKSWFTLLIRAKLNNVRLHDLRRTLGSWQTMTGASTAIVGKTLGHKSPEATAVYARLNLDPVRASMETAVHAMFAAKDMPEKIVSIGDEK